MVGSLQDGGDGGKPGSRSCMVAPGSWVPSRGFPPFPAPVSPMEVCPLGLESAGLIRRSRQHVCALSLDSHHTLGVSVRAFSPAGAAEHVLRGRHSTLWCL